MENFRQQLFQLINSTKLPAECVYYIIKDVYREVEDTYKTFLSNTMMTEQLAQQETETIEE